jgi:branched-subunit amino acid ABC-type transport system permease component
VLAVPGSVMTVDTGTLLGLKGLVAAVAARFGRPRAVLLAGIGLGVVETVISVVDLGPLSLGPAYRDVIPIALVLAFMALKPARPELQEAT